MKAFNKRNAWWLVLSVFVIIFDQLSKQWILHSLTLYEVVPILPSFNLTLAFNSGAAFSFLSSSGPWHHWFFLCFAPLMSVILLIWLLRLPTKQSLCALSLSLILGGALGNFLDRLYYGHVIDFLDVYYKNHHWPAFNVADSAITLGAMMLILDMFLANKKGDL